LRAQFSLTRGVIYGRLPLTGMNSPAHISPVFEKSLASPVELRLVLSVLVLGIIAGCGPPF
jgi:hypothetical protein